MTETATEEPKTFWVASGKFSRSITLSGVVLLCVCFFLPQVRGCGMVIVPVRETVATRGLFLLGLGLPFLTGFVAFLVAVLWCAVSGPRARRHVAGVSCAATALLLGLGAGRLLAEFAASSTLVGAGVLLVECAVVLYVWARCRPTLKIPVCLLCTSVPSLAYFLFVSQSVLSAAYGLWLSVLACTLMAVGSLGEILGALASRNCPERCGSARPVRQVALLAGLSTLLAVGGCSSYVTFEGCEAEPVCRLLEQAVDLAVHEQVDLEPNKPLNLSREGTLFSRGYRLSCGVETSGTQTTARLTIEQIHLFLPFIIWRCKGEEKMLLGLVTEALLRHEDAQVVGASDPVYKRLRPIPGGEQWNTSSVTLYGVTQQEVIGCLRERDALDFIGPGLDGGANMGEGLCPITVTCLAPVQATSRKWASDSRGRRSVPLR